jgi:ABC-2 type transport system ATP-binding protein
VLPGERASVLEFHDLHRSFGDVVALDGLTFSVAPGELCGFLGPNGAGKTTAMRCAVGVTEPDAGSVTWQGRPIDLRVRRSTGYMPEERGLYPKMRVHEQLVYLGRLHEMTTHDASVSADHWIDRLGLSERRDSAVEELSLGNQQRVQLAAALVHDPALLVLDEPFSGLDPIATDVMSDVLLERAHAGVAVMFSSHQLDLVEGLCETVAVISRGKLVLGGVVAELKAGGGRRLRIVAEGGIGWTRSVTGDAEVVAIDGLGATVLLPPGSDAGPVLDVARQQGRLLDVHLEQPRLSELFRNAVGNGESALEEPAGVEPEVRR